MNIYAAKEVQIIADGAPWIWNSLPELVESLGVEKSKITMTLDYYHAISYVQKLIDCMKYKYVKATIERKLKEYKNWLWRGESSKIAEACRKIFKRPSQEIARYINYLEKHENKTQYVDYKANSQFCGSGLVESGIRRVINLRFKNPSTFWEKDNVEKLFFLRATFLSKRWNTLIQNLTKSV